MTGVCAGAVVLALVPLVSVFWLLFAKGFSALSWSLFTSLPSPVGEAGGGVGNAILGTLLLVGLACVLGLPIGIGTGLFLAERGNGPAGGARSLLAPGFFRRPSIVLRIVALRL